MLFSEEDNVQQNKVLRLKGGRVRQQINKVKLCEIVLFFKVRLLFSLFRHKENQSVKIFLFHQTTLCTFKVFKC